MNSKNIKSLHPLWNEPFRIWILLMILIVAILISDQYIAAANPGKGTLVLWLGGGVFSFIFGYWLWQYRYIVKEMEEAKERFQIISQVTNDGIWDWDFKSGRSWRNAGFSRLFGYEPEQIVDHIAWWEERIHPQDREKVLESIHSAINENAETWECEYRFRRMDDNYVLVLDRGYILRDSQGNAKRMLGAILDVTKWRATEEALRKAEEKYRSIYENAIEGIYQSTPDGKLISANPSLALMLGYGSPEELMRYIGNLASSFYVQPGRREEFIRSLEKERVVTAFESEVFRKDGSTMWISENARAVYDVSGAIQYYEGTIENITARKQAELAVQELTKRQASWIRDLERHNREVALLHQMSNSLQTCYSLEEAYVIISEQMPLLFPEESGILYMLDSTQGLMEAVAYFGMDMAEPIIIRTKECWGMKKKLMHIHKTISNAAQPTNTNTALCHHYLSCSQMEHACIPLITQGESIGLLHLRNNHANNLPQNNEWFPNHKQQLLQTVADSLALVLANLKLRDALREQSIRDPLTNLFNRRYLEETLEREIHRTERESRSLSVIMLDIDHFKAYNDSYGHAAGDIVLREVSMYLTSQIRAGDIACRYGGEEFILIMPEAPLSIALERAEKIRIGVQNLKLKLNNIPLGKITISVGVAAFPEHGITGAGIIRAADEALYHSKQTGRNRVSVASSNGQPETLAEPPGKI